MRFFAVNDNQKIEPGTGVADSKKHVCDVMGPERFWSIQFAELRIIKKLFLMGDTFRPAC